MLRLKEILQEKNISIKSLACDFGSSPQYISNIVCERDTPSLKTLIKIADILNVPLPSLFSDFSDDNTIVCPHCGATLRVDIK